MSAPLDITYPTGWLLAVANTDAVAERGRARAELVGVREVLRLDVAGPSVASLAKPGNFGRFINLLRHLSTDQSADLIVYEGARVAGRTVLAVRGVNETQRRALASAWKAEGLHFINYFGGVASEDWGIWQGPILPELPSWVWR